MPNGRPRTGKPSPVANHKHGKAWNKTQSAALDRRIEEMLGLLHTQRAITELLAVDEKVGLSAEWLRKRVGKVWREIVERDRAERPIRKELMRHALREHYRAARTVGEWQAATKAMDMLCKLDGLYAPVEVRVDTMTDDKARRARIELLLNANTQGEQPEDVFARAEAAADADETPPN